MTSGSPSDFFPQLLARPTAARDSPRVVSYLSIMGGVFTLVFMLLMACQPGNAFLNVTCLGFLGGGAAALALGLGLLRARSEGRRGAVQRFLDPYTGQTPGETEGAEAPGNL